MNINIEVSEDEMFFLKQLNKDYLIQQEKNQAPYPSIYVLVDYKEIATDPERSGVYPTYFDVSSGEYCKIGDWDDMVTYLKTDSSYTDDVETYVSRYKKEWLEDFDWEDDDLVKELYESLEECFDEIFLEDRAEDVQTFLSYESADSHLKQNYYHYHKKAFVDRRRPHRNEEMNTLIKLLYKIGEQVIK